MATTQASRTTASTVHAMADAARWAPSVHNSQPWLFRSLPDGLRVLADPDRGLPVLDPAGRLLAVSCGAAVVCAEVAAAAAGAATSTRLLPEGARGRAVADVVVTGDREPGAHDRLLAEAVRTRRTHRRLHARESVDASALDRLADVVAGTGARLAVLDLPARRHLARLLVRAARQQERDARLLRETRSWLRPPVGRDVPQPTDGVLVASLGTTPYPTDSLVHRAGQTGPGAAQAEDLVEAVAASTVVVLTTAGDSRRDHLVAGQALQRLLLEATVGGLVATFADQATQRPDTRDDVSDLAGAGHAQLVLRLGHPLVDVRVPPRRPLDDLLDPAGPPPAGQDHTETSRRR